MEKLELKTETINLIQNELANIPEKHRKTFNSTHEGYAVLLEEVRELENEIFFGEKKLKKMFLSEKEAIEKHKQRIREEAIQVAAMAIRIIQELT